MTITDLLNADMATIARTARRGFDWWRGELAGMMPQWLAAGLSGGTTRLSAWHRLDAHGEVIVASNRAADTLVIGAEQALVREIVLPRLSHADLAALVELEAERLLPLVPASVVLGLRVLGPVEGDPARLRVRLGALPLARATALADALNRADCRPRAIGPLAIDGTDRLDCDFAPAMRKAGLISPRPAVARGWWLAVAALALANLGAAILADQQRVDRLQALVDAQEPALGAVRKVEDRLRANAALIETWRIRRAHHQPLALLAALDATLPAKAWIEHTDWDGRALRLNGAAVPNAHVVEAFKASPAFRAVRASRAETVTAGNAGRPFELTAETAFADPPTAAIQPAGQEKERP